MLEHELDDLALYMRDAQRDGEVVVRRNPLECRHDHKRRAPQEVEERRRQAAVVVVADAKHADELPLVAHAERMEDLEPRHGVGRGRFPAGVGLEPLELVFVERDDGTDLESRVEGTPQLGVYGPCQLVHPPAPVQHALRQNRPTALGAEILHHIADVGVKALAHYLQHLPRLRGTRLLLQRNERALELTLVLLVFVLAVQDVLDSRLALVQPLAVGQQVGRLVYVGDDSVCELLARCLDEVEPREPAYRAARPNERRRYQRLDALRRKPLARTGVDGFYVGEEEVPPRSYAGVELDEVGEVARLLAADLGLDPLGAPLVRVGAHGRLAGIPEAVDVAAVRPDVAPYRGEDEVGRVLVGRGLYDVLQQRAEQRTVVAQSVGGAVVLFHIRWPIFSFFVSR